MIIAVSIIQGAWYALSLKPWIYDEARHFENIQIYTTQLSPFLGQQQPAWDHLGEVVRDGSYMFYYVMSWPLRFLSWINSDPTFQMIGLRFICMAFFVYALILMRRALSEIRGFSGGMINLALLVFVLTPAAGFLAGIVNYDSLVFLLFALLFLLTVRIVKDSKLNAHRLIVLIMVSLFISVVKWTSIALVIPLLGYIAYDLIRKRNKNAFMELKSSFLRISSKTKIVLIIGVIITGALFIERPVTNTIIYGKPSPQCEAVIGADRCNEFRDYTIYSKLRASKSPSFVPMSHFQYVTQYWLPTMSNTMTNLLELGGASQLPVTTKLYMLLLISSIALVLVALRDILKNKARSMALILVAGYSLLLLIDEYGSYKLYGAPVATRARYLVPVLPIYITLCIFSINLLLSKYKKLLLISGVSLVLLLSQGGSIVTYVLTTPESAYWNKSSLEFNKTLKNLLEPVVKQ